MSVRPIVLFKTNETELRQKSVKVTDFTSDTLALIADLKDTLRHHPNGIGLAAPQIGVHQRVAVVCFGATKNRKPGPPIGIVNPVIVETNRELLDCDGCLSLPGLYADTIRPHSLHLQGLDESGKPFDWTLEGMNAVVVHHELDHLDGVLFIDRVPPNGRYYTDDETGDVFV